MPTYFKTIFFDADLYRFYDCHKNLPYIILLSNLIFSDTKGGLLQWLLCLV
jgi:hypothetical protein